MLKVYLTVDVEIWPENWDMSPSRFSEYYRKYITGGTSSGDYGLPFQLRLLKSHGLKCIFFVEPFFAFHFGMSALNEIVSMIQADGHAVDLHAHTEWIGRTRRSIPPGRFELNLRDYSLAEQTQIIETGRQALEECGAVGITGFRAGNFGASRDTLSALAANGIMVDSSYNLACRYGAFLKETMYQPARVDGVAEYPVAVFKDGFGRHRHAQIGASSSFELIEAMEQARLAGWSAFVVFWHSGELLNRRKSRVDPIALRRYERICEFLARNPAVYQTAFFEGEVAGATTSPAGVAIHTGRAAALSRLAGQAVRRLWGS